LYCYLYIAYCFLLECLNILLSPIILSHIHISPPPCSVTTYPVYKTKILKYINCIINRNFVPYLYFSHIMLLIILYIALQTLKYIKCIFKWSIIPYPYFLQFMLIIILYIQLHILKYINCIVNCNIFLFIFPMLYK
jgi:hypothetical protein